MTIINKFGGEIIGNPHLVQLAVKRLKEQLNPVRNFKSNVSYSDLASKISNGVKRNQKPIVVVSALAGVTDKLLKLSLSASATPKALQAGQNYDKKVIGELEKQHRDWRERLKVNSQKLESEFQNLKQELEEDLKRVKEGKNGLVIQDRILAYGEKLSALLFTELLIKNGIQAEKLTGEELGIITDENFGDANIVYGESVRNIKSKLKNFSQLPVITGFIGRTRQGETTTLGRGGSDTTACLLGAGLNASKVILWKNVPGVLSADPKIVKNPKAVKFLSYEEAEESGKVIHNKSLSLVKGKGIRVEVTYIAAPHQKTIIENNVPKKDGAKIISSRNDLYLLVIAGDKITQAGALFEIAKIISKEGINMVLIRNTKESLYIVVEKNSYNLLNCEQKISDLGYHLSIKEVSMVNAVGRMDWKIAERFNQLLYKFCPEAELGAFPYRNCLRLDAIIEILKVKKLIKIFHKELVL